MTQEAAKSGRGKMLRRAVALLCVAAAACFVYAYTAKYLAERPRFDEAAWTDANAVLVEVVGKDAVERGVVTIPKAKIAVPRRAFARTGLCPSTVITCEVLHGPCMMLFLDGPRSFIVRKSETCPFADPVALIDEEKARHIVSVLHYLEWLQAPTVTGAVSRNEGELYRSFSLDAANYGYATVSPEGKKLDTGAIALQLKGHLALAYVEGLFRRSEVRIATDADAIRALGKALLEHGLPPRNACDGLRMNYGIGFLTTYPDTSAIALLARAFKISQRGKADTWWKRLPLVSQFCAREKCEEYLSSADDAIRAETTLAGKPEGERAQTAFDAHPPNRGMPSWATWYLPTARPSDYAQLLASSLPSCDSTARREMISTYYRIWGKDVRVAQAGTRDTVVQTRFAANLQIFKLTRDPKALSACLACLGALYDPAKDVRYLLARYYGSLTQAYFDDPTLDQIPAAFLAVVNGAGDEQALAQYLQPVPEAMERILAVLLMAGGKENTGAAIRIASAYEIADLASPRGGYFSVHTDMYMGYPTMYAVQNARDPQTIERIIEFLQARSPKLSSGVCEALVRGLAERGETRLAPILAAALEEDRRSPTGRKCADQDKGYALMDFTDFLNRARMIVEMRNAADPIAYLSDTKARDLQLLQEATARFLEERYTTPQLQALLADERCGGFQSAICLAIMHQREKDTLAQWQ